MAVTLPLFSSPTIARNNHNLIRLADVHRLLGRRRQTVHMWATRRRTSQFPEPKGLLRYGTGWVELFDQTEVINWYAAYVPAPGGAPLGNRNWVPKSKKTTS